MKKTDKGGKILQREITNQKYGKILFNENIWTGKKTLSVEGAPLEKKGKNEFLMPDGKTGYLKGNTITGVTLTAGTETIRLTPSLKWYEVVLSLLPFVLIMVWGNSVQLCSIVPVVGGAIGGGISGACVAINLFCVKTTDNILLKILITLGVLAACFLVCYGIAAAILSAAA